MNVPGAPHALALFDPFELDPRGVYPIEAAARLSRAPRRRIAFYCQHRLVAPVADPAQAGWFFDAVAIRALRRLEFLRSIGDMSPPALRMILDLEEEVARLRSQLRRLAGTEIAP
jgi:hypothetical protein